MHIINTIVSGLIFFILSIIASKFPKKKLYLITSINALIFALLFSLIFSLINYTSFNANEGFRDNVDKSFKEGVVYYYDTVPTTETCDVGDKETITFYYNEGTKEKHEDSKNKAYTCKKIVTAPKYPVYSGGGKGGGGYVKQEPVITYEIKPVIMDPSFNCPESLDYDSEKGMCFIPKTKVFQGGEEVPRKYKCEHAVGKITYKYNDRDSRDYQCDLSGRRFIMPNDKE